MNNQTNSVDCCVCKFAVSLIFLALLQCPCRCCTLCLKTIINPALILINTNTIYKYLFETERAAAGWAPHAYFQMLADRNGADSPGCSGGNSPTRKQHQKAVEVQPVGGGSVDSNSPV